MKLNLMEVPFSTRGSYLAVSYLEGKFQGKEVETGLYLRTVHGSAKIFFSLPVSLRCTRKKHCSIHMRQSLRISESTQNTGRRESPLRMIRQWCLTGMWIWELDFMSEGTMFTFAQPWKSGDRDFYLVNCFKRQLPLYAPCRGGYHHTGPEMECEHSGVLPAAARGRYRGKVCRLHWKRILKTGWTEAWTMIMRKW